MNKKWGGGEKNARTQLLNENKAFAIRNLLVAGMKIMNNTKTEKKNKNTSTLTLEMGTITSALLSLDAIWKCQSCTSHTKII